ncbi:hypothetical protein FGM00_11180 [Aggregatimonas sangjinii]|uniref:Uncharacterized protein n=1 Tax=Aggregatimonas sangjinii TaxID=2583587 RepID=A0A5B7STH4_9FLAO|nr:hypothetical protein [Aggregatimonas sangjinii]QCX00639.1 hypothetical protein FGM00_11180 [Aggregatimonas sangjinii]
MEQTTLETAMAELTELRAITGRLNLRLNELRTRNSTRDDLELITAENRLLNLAERANIQRNINRGNQDNTEGQDLNQIDRLGTIIRVEREFVMRLTLTVNQLELTARIIDEAEQRLSDNDTTLDENPRAINEAIASIMANDVPPEINNEPNYLGAIPVEGMALMEEFSVQSGESNITDHTPLEASDRAFIQDTNRLAEVQTRVNELNHRLLNLRATNAVRPNFIAAENRLLNNIERTNIERTILRTQNTGGVLADDTHERLRTRILVEEALESRLTFTANLLETTTRIIDRAEQILLDNNATTLAERPRALNEAIVELRANDFTPGLNNAQDHLGARNPGTMAFQDQISMMSGESDSTILDIIEEISSRLPVNAAIAGNTANKNSERINTIETNTPRPLGGLTNSELQEIIDRPGGSNFTVEQQFAFAELELRQGLGPLPQGTAVIPENPTGINLENDGVEIPNENRAGQALDLSAFTRPTNPINPSNPSVEAGPSGIRERENRGTPNAIQNENRSSPELKQVRKGKNSIYKKK